MANSQDIEKVELGGPTTQIPSLTNGQLKTDEALAHDAVFGDITEKGPNYRDVRVY